MGTIDCELHGKSQDILFDDRLVCELCIKEYQANMTELEEIAKETLLQVHEAVGRGLRSRLQDREAFNRLKVATISGLDIAATYHRIVTDVCQKIKMN